jgi:hypothetical protein
MQFDSSKIAYLALLDWILALHIVPQIRYLGFTTRGKKGPLTTTGDLSTCKSKRTLIQLLTVNKPLFLVLLPGNKQSRSNLVSLIFQFFFWFSFASLKFDHPQKNQSNLVLINPNFSFFVWFLFLLTLTGDGWLPLQETQNFLWMIQENFTGKGDVQHKLKGWKP